MSFVGAVIEARLGIRAAFSGYSLSPGANDQRIHAAAASEFPHLGRLRDALFR